MLGLPQQNIFAFSKCDTGTEKTTHGLNYCFLHKYSIRLALKILGDGAACIDSGNKFQHLGPLQVTEVM